jgi:glucose/arabinose dehydrogenase
MSNRSSRATNPINYKVHRGRARWWLVSMLLALAACSPQSTPTPTLPQATATFQPTQTATAPIPPTLTVPPSPTATSPFRADFPDPSGYTWMVAASGLDLPVDIQNAGDDSGRLFIIEKVGDIRILQDGQLLPTPFLNIRDQVDSRGSEQGLLGLAFHPDYANYGLFYVDYIDLNGNTVVARFHVSADNPDQADPSSEVDILHIQQPYANHNGGQLAFGPDGYLYIGAGDGGSERDPNRTGQNLQTLLGKLLRIDVDHGDPYSIPADNPYVQGGGMPEIWASGLRNPWRFSFDRLTGDLYIGDVGQDAWEEVDTVPTGTTGGLNFGWSYYEGDHTYNDTAPADISFTFPVTEYSHAYGCAITGGYIYRGSAFPAWDGIYIYGDYCSGRIWGLIRTGEDTWQSKQLFSTNARISSFGTDEAGELYLADYGSGSVLKLSHP